MGTRNLIAVVINGEYKIAQYGQWDGYPEGQGKTVLKFLSKEQNIEKLRDMAPKCRWITPPEWDKAWEEFRVGPKSEFIDIATAEKFKKKHPHLDRDCGAEILGLVADGKAEILKDSLNFAGDSLFCEWGYVVDLDKDKLEVYKGFNKEPLSDTERFFSIKVEPDKNGKVEYFPIKLCASYDLHDLPSVEKMDKDCNPEEE